MNEPIEIKQVGNGYAVRQAITDIPQVVSDESTFVFQSFAELVAWLGEHFDYRANSLKSD